MDVIGVYLKMIIASFFPALATAGLMHLDKNTHFGKLKKPIKQIIFGLVFGALAIVGTEWGIPFGGAQANCRDAAVLTAGFIFGTPAGIIAGIIGGVERWFAVYWGIGEFSRVACSVSTIIAGFYAAALRKLIFDNRKPTAFIAFFSGFVMETFHMTMMFITNMNDLSNVMVVIKNCTAPMLILNAFAVMLSTFAATAVQKDRAQIKKHRRHISKIIQKWLLITVIFAALTTSLFVFAVQDRIAFSQLDSLLEIAINEVSAEIRDESSNELLTISHKITDELTNGMSDSEEKDVIRWDFEGLAQKYNISEINYVNSKGIIVKSTNPKLVGFDMHSLEQSSEFLCLLEDKNDFVLEFGSIQLDPSIKMKYVGVKYRGGFIQVGYDEARFREMVAATISDITKNRHIGRTGFTFIIDGHSNIVSRPASYDSRTLLASIGNISEHAEGDTFGIVIESEPCYCCYKNIEGYYVISVLPELEALWTRNIALTVHIFMEIIVFAVMFALIYILIKKVVVEKIKSVNSSLAKITDGDLNEVVSVGSSAEFEMLSKDINSTVDTLKNYIDEASARIDKELEFAKSIQSSALPDVLQSFNMHHEFEIFASMDPAKEVGGDFYDAYLTNNNTLNFLVADVSGKGIPAAMFMMRAKTELKSLTEINIPLAEVFTRGNNALCEGNDAGMFVTAWQGSIELKTGIVRYVNAGHNPPLIRRKGGKFEFLRSRPGFVLAGMRGVKYKVQEIKLNPGDEMYLYTDGVTEATNKSDVLYGEERLLATINSREFKSMKEMCEYIKSDIDAFVGDADQFDDITMVAMRYEGEKPLPTIKFSRSAIEDIPAVTEFIETELEKIGCPMKMITQINVAIDEIYSNIVKYGYPHNNGPVTVKFLEKEDPHRVYVRFADQGVPYNPLMYQDPDITLSAEERSIGGLGIFMVKKTMDDIKYKYENGENVLTIMKRLE